MYSLFTFMTTDRNAHYHNRWRATNIDRDFTLWIGMIFRFKKAMLLLISTMLAMCYMCIYQHINRNIALLVYQPIKSQLSTAGCLETSKRRHVYVNRSLSYAETPSKNWFAHCDEDFRSSHLVLGLPTGRTGNLLFELFTLLGLSRDYCYTAVLMPYNYNLDNIFDIRHVTRRDVNNTDFLLLWEPPYTCRTFNVEFFNTLDTRKNWTLHGYRQSYKLFAHHEDFMKASVTFKPDIMTNVTLFLEKENLTNNPLCSIHVRRGDMAFKDKNNWYIPHIQRSIGYIQMKVPDVKFLFLSDNITWCKEHFLNTSSSDDLYFSPFVSPGIDLALMAVSNHTILTADSTFGWMGAWLGAKGTDAYIVYSSHRRNNADYYPVDWIQL